MESSSKQKIWKHKDYLSKTDYYRTRDKKRREKFKKIVRDAKIGFPCLRCGKSFHFSAMEFHHRDRGAKSFTISNLQIISSEKKLREEIVKCDVVCANCHRIITWMETTGEGSPDSF